MHRDTQGRPLHRPFFFAPARPAGRLAHTSLAAICGCAGRGAGRGGSGLVGRLPPTINNASNCDRLSAGTSPTAQYVKSPMRTAPGCCGQRALPHAQARANGLRGQPQLGRLLRHHDNGNLPMRRGHHVAARDAAAKVGDAAAANGHPWFSRGMAGVKPRFLRKYSASLAGSSCCKSPCRRPGCAGECRSIPAGRRWPARGCGSKTPTARPAKAKPLPPLAPARACA